MYVPEPPYTVGLPPFDKYFYYRASVQSPQEDMAFLDQVYRDVHGAKRTARTMREDFCGTFSNCCEWVRTAENREAFGIDLDPEPIAYGKANYLAELAPDQQARVHILQRDVTAPGLPSTDLICAMNFSYFIFKQRATLVAYFKNCLAALNDGGIMILDCFGGTGCSEPNEEETEHPDLKMSYYWDQVSFDPLTSQALFYIHFKRNGERKRRKVFEYDWRMWSVPELKDALLDAGFSRVNLYWEGVQDDGTGDGNYALAERGDECESWVAYIAAVK